MGNRLEGQWRAGKSPGARREYLITPHYRQRWTTRCLLPRLQSPLNRGAPAGAGVCLAVASAAPAPWGAGQARVVRELREERLREPSAERLLTSQTVISQEEGARWVLKKFLKKQQ